MVFFAILLLFLALIGAPLFTVLASGALLASYAEEISPDILIIEMNRLTTSPNMVALPLFILAGVIMAHGGAPKRLVTFYRANFGFLPGGIAVVTLISCAFFTMFSGASGVTILALGGLLYPILKNEGYPQNFNLGLLTTSGSLGLLFPPSLAMIIYAIVAKVSIEDMFFAGLVPGLMLIVMLSVYSAYVSRKNEVKHHVYVLSDALNSCKQCFFDLLLPLGLVLGIFGGFVSLTEAAAVTAAYLLFIETTLYKTISLKKHGLTLLTEASLLFGSLIIILLIALGLTNLLIDAQIPTRLLDFFERFIDNKIQFLILLNIFLLLVGALMDIFSALLVVVPLLLPLAARYDINLIHLGIIFIANLEIGYSTPPIGINLFIASQRFKKPVHVLFKSTLPFLLIMLIWLLAITYLPELSLWWQ
ncbi:TRAP-type C4-dicarboxylate transport system, large permease component [hydrothermal vent metagenome]|uniref:TRAP-type C4-dicarboxylate transport system, large permease component n=1 Tax=hydrothermal vent metagenome TaxID=652676 RepID=A0A3B0WQL3_9ZZZZ